MTWAHTIPLAFVEVTPLCLKRKQHAGRARLDTVTAAVSLDDEDDANDPRSSHNVVFAAPCPLPPPSLSGPMAKLQLRRLSDDCEWNVPVSRKGREGVRIGRGGGRRRVGRRRVGYRMRLLLDDLDDDDDDDNDDDDNNNNNDENDSCRDEAEAEAEDGAEDEADRVRVGGDIDQIGDDDRLGANRLEQTWPRPRPRPRQAVDSAVLGGTIVLRPQRRRCDSSWQRGTNRTTGRGAAKKEKEEEHTDHNEDDDENGHGELVLYLRPDDPTYADGNAHDDDEIEKRSEIPCLVRGYAPFDRGGPLDPYPIHKHDDDNHDNHDDVWNNVRQRGASARCKRRIIIPTYVNVVVTQGTLVRVLPPATLDATTKSATTMTSYPSLLCSLSGELPLRRSYYASYHHHRRRRSPCIAPPSANANANADAHASTVSAVASIDDDEAILSSHDPETVRSLSLRMSLLLSRPVLIGTTSNAIVLHNDKADRRRRREDALMRFWDIVTKKERHENDNENENENENEEEDEKEEEQEEEKEETPTMSISATTMMGKLDALKKGDVSQSDDIDDIDNISPKMGVSENGANANELDNNNADNHDKHVNVNDDFCDEGMEGGKTNRFARSHHCPIRHHLGRPHVAFAKSTGGEGGGEKVKVKGEFGGFGLMRNRGGLVVHSPHHGHGKTLLVAAIARRLSVPGHGNNVGRRSYYDVGRVGRGVGTSRDDGKTSAAEGDTEARTGVEAIHIVNAPSLLARYGAGGADAALESLLHGIVMSAAVRVRDGRCKRGGGGGGRGERVGSVCVILDGLDAFVPPSMMGGGNGSGSGSGRGGDPALSTLDAIAAYLSKLSHSLGTVGEFPFPTKNPMYNLISSDDDDHDDYYSVVGFVLPVRVALVGIVTCDDDGGGRRRALLHSATDPSSSLSSSSSSYLLSPSRTVLDIFGGGARFRLPTAAISTATMGAGTVVGVGDGPRATIAAVADDGDPNPNSGSDSDSDPFATVGGSAPAKVALRDALALDGRVRSALAALGRSAPTGVLLYGPPGTGKTLLARATADALRRRPGRGRGRGIDRKGRGGGGKGAFISLRADEIIRSEIGNSEKAVTGAFDLARRNAPSVVFIDEFQALFVERGRGGGGGSGRLASTLLQCMDDVARWRDADAAAAAAAAVARVSNGDGGNGQDDMDEGRRDAAGRVVVLGATNAPWMVDRAFLRRGRFDRSIHVGLPDVRERESILSVHLGRMTLSDELKVPNALQRLCGELAKGTDGFSGADLAAVCRAAAVRCLRDGSSEEGVAERHFVEARAQDVKRSSSAKIVARIAAWKPNKANN